MATKIKSTLKAAKVDNKITKIGESTYVAAITSLAFDDTYIYAGQGTYVKKYLKSDLSLVGTTATVGGTVYTVAVDQDYIYTGGATSYTVKKYLKSDMSYIGQTATYSYAINSLVVDGTYIYAGGGAGNTTARQVVMYTKSTLATYSTFTTSYAGTIRTIAQDDTYLYVGGFAKKVYKYVKSSPTTAAIVAAATYGGNIYSIIADDSYLYVGGDITPFLVQKYLKSDLSYILSSAAYGGLIWTIAQNTDYIYVSGSKIDSTSTNITNIIKLAKPNLSTVVSVSDYCMDVHSLVVDADNIYAGIYLQPYCVQKFTDKSTVWFY